MKVKSLKFYGITRHPKTNEFILIYEFAKTIHLRKILSNKFHEILWKDKMIYLFDIIHELKTLHEFEFCHKNFHTRNILLKKSTKGKEIYLSDFGLSGPADKQPLDDKVYGVFPFI